jgi:hypothetical protein
MITIAISNKVEYYWAETSRKSASSKTKETTIAKKSTETLYSHVRLSMVLDYSSKKEKHETTKMNQTDDECTSSFLDCASAFALSRLTQA